MTLWWASKDQLDVDQINLIEKIPICQNSVVLGPPGSGKTNVLLRRAQFVKTQGYPNVMVLTFTRALTEFIKTGCTDGQGRIVFPISSVNTVESWIRELYRKHDMDLPDYDKNMSVWKPRLAEGAMGFAGLNRFPKYDILFVDECQDLYPEEIRLFSQWCNYLFIVGDNNQKIYGQSNGIMHARKHVAGLQEYILRFHYRLAPEICRVADRILVPASGEMLEPTSQYNGPKSGRINISHVNISETRQLEETADRLKEQLRIYGDYIKQGDRFGVIVHRTSDREKVFEYLENDPDLAGKSKIIRARMDGEFDFDPSFYDEKPICIVTVHGSKGLEFRGLHWLFADQGDRWYTDEHYYTVVTRAKTDIDIMCTDCVPGILSRIHSSNEPPSW